MSLADALKATYAGVTFVADAVRTADAPIVDQVAGQIGIKSTASLNLYVDGVDAADLASKVAVARAALNTSGANLSVVAFGNAEIYSLLAAQCQRGGPFLTVRARPDSKMPLRYVFETEVSGEQFAYRLGGISATDAGTLTAKIRPDGLREITRAGKVIGLNAPDYFATTTLAEWSRTYAGWVVEAEVQTPTAAQDPNQASANYTMRAVELAGPLPASPAAVQGTYQVVTERDEQYRLTTTHNYDLLLGRTASPVAVLNLIRPKNPLRESSQIEQVSERRVRAQFVVLQSGDATPLMNYRQSVRVAPASVTYEEKRYLGAAPLLIQKPSGFARVVQEGQAICQGVFLKPPPPIEDKLLEAPDVSYTELSSVERQTTWRYVFARLDDKKDFALTPEMTGRPPAPEFLSV